MPMQAHCLRPALGLALVLLAGNAAPAQEKKEEFYQDFRGKPLHPALTWDGTNGEEVIEPSDKGLRIFLRPGRAKKEAVALELKQPVAGDFEVTLGYEILEIHKPSNPYGAGVELWLRTDTGTKEAIALAAGKRPGGQDMYLCSRMTTQDGKRVGKNEFVPSSARAGHLRISRKGKEAALSAREGEERSFKEVCRFELGTEDLKAVRVSVIPGNPTTPLDVRLLELRVASSPTADMAGEAAAPEEEKAVAKGWLLAVEIGGLGALVTAVGLGVWLHRRRRRTRRSGTAGQLRA